MRKLELNLENERIINKPTKYRGVAKTKGGKWVAMYAGKYLGRFHSDIDAAIAYNEKAFEIKGERAKLNIIPDGHVLRGRIITSSRYRGVSKLKSGKWIACCAGIYLGTFHLEIDAAVAYNEKAYEIYGEKAELNTIPVDHVASGRIRIHKTSTSGYLGVRQRIKGGHWQSYYSNKYLGTYHSEIDAAIAYNEKAREVLGGEAKLNVIPEGHIPVSKIPNRQSEEYRIFKGYTSKYIGVSWYKHRSKWVTQIKRNKKQVFKRTYNTEIEAAKAYDQKAVELDGENAVLNFPELKEEYLRNIDIVPLHLDNWII